MPLEKNRHITEEEEPICKEESQSSENENQIDRANDQIVEVFVDIAQSRDEQKE